MGMHQNLTIKFPELGELFRSKRSFLSYSCALVANEVLGDRHFKWKIVDIERGLVRSTQEALALVDSLIAFYEVSDDELEKIDFENQFSKIRVEIERRVWAESNEALLPISRPSRYDPRA